MATDPLNPLGILASIRGNYTKAVDLGKKAQEQSQARSDQGNLMFSYYVLAGAYLAQADVDSATTHALLAYD